MIQAMTSYKRQTMETEKVSVCQHCIREGYMGRVEDHQGNETNVLSFT